jgi:uncharacterized ferritin-like protein (DUF455 family)
MTLRNESQRLLRLTDAEEKAASVLALDPQGAVDTLAVIDEVPGIPGRPSRPELVPPSRLENRAVNTVSGRAALLHALAHIEANAVSLALDIVWRFAGMPEQFYRDWLNVAREEALHFSLLRDHLRSLGYAYGDFPAHDALWEMAERTKGDILARLALVPRTLEARGLDASPAVKAKLVSAGDVRGGEILDVILRDEIGHVAIGNRWYRTVCALRHLDPIATYADLAARYRAPRLRGPFNLEARRAAGFDDAELAALQAGSSAPQPTSRTT